MPPARKSAFNTLLPLSGPSAVGQNRSDLIHDRLQVVRPSEHQLPPTFMLAQALGRHARSLPGWSLDLVSGGHKLIKEATRLRQSRQI